MRYIIILLTIFFSFYSKSQTFLTVKSVKYENNRISAYNAQNHVVYQVDCKDFVWQRNPDLTIKVWDDIHSFTLTSTIISPTWAAIEDSLRSWQTACTSSGEGSIDINGLDTSSQDTSLVVPSLIENTNTLLEAILLRNLDTTHTDTSLVQSEQLYQIIDSLGVINEKLNHLYNLDTTQQDTSLINYYSQFDRQNDTLSSILYAIKTKTDTSNAYILEQIRINIADSLRTSVYINNDSVNVHVLNNIIDSTYYLLLDSIVRLLQEDTTTDTLKILAFKPLTKDISGTVDTLYNCKGLTFRANSTATGTLLLYYENGEIDSYDIATEELPTWDNSTFLTFVGYDATGVIGKLRINTVGCSQVPTSSCVKEVPLIDCDSGTPIPTCSGWASVSGIWSSISGCWNTGQ